MKPKFLVVTAIAAVCLSSCSTGVRHKMSEYILEYDIGSASEFKILQLTDIHVGDKDYQDLHYKFMDLTIKDANPNMIIVTGDLFTFGSKDTAKTLFKFLDSYDVPWTLTFGNHDEQVYFSIDWMTNELMTGGYKHCLFKDIQDDDVHGNANFAINLKKSGSIFEQLIIMDSNRYYFGNYFGYDFFKPNQINWYKDLVNYTKDTLNGGTVAKSLMFYHIPLPEIDNAWDDYKAGKSIAQWVSDGEVAGHPRDKREKSCPPDYNSGFFKVIKEMNSTTGMYFGHDHVNNFIIKYDGIDFAYGIKSTFNIYYDEQMLGGRTITINSEHKVQYQDIYHTYAEVM